MLHAHAAPPGLPDVMKKDPVNVLIVEDDRRLAYLLRRTFTDEHCHVDLVHVAREAREIVERSTHDVIIIDRALPHLDGVDLCRQIRTSGVSTPLLVLTPHEAVDDRVACISAGADDYVAKPFGLHEILARTGSVMRRRRPAPFAVTTRHVGDLVLHITKRGAWHAGRSIPVTDSEFILLEYLARHPGQIVTRRQMIDHVWSYDLDDTASMVDSCVRALREKIEGASAQVRIKSVLSAGYTLEIQPKP